MLSTKRALGSALRKGMGVNVARRCTESGKEPRHNAIHLISNCIVMDQYALLTLLARPQARPAQRRFRREERDELHRGM